MDVLKPLIDKREVMLTPQGMWTAAFLLCYYLIVFKRTLLVTSFQLFPSSSALTQFFFSGFGIIYELIDEGSYWYTP